MIYGSQLLRFFSVPKKFFHFSALVVANRLAVRSTAELHTSRNGHPKWSINSPSKQNSNSSSIEGVTNKYVFFSDLDDSQAASLSLKTSTRHVSCLITTHTKNIY